MNEIEIIGFYFDENDIFAGFVYDDNSKHKNVVYATKDLISKVIEMQRLTEIKYIGEYNTRDIVTDFNLFKEFKKEPDTPIESEFEMLKNELDELRKELNELQGFIKSEVLKR